MEAKVVRVLSPVVGCGVAGLAMVNAGRGQWGLAVAGVVLCAGIAVALESLRPPTGR